MAIEFKKNFFSSKDDVLRDMIKENTWPWMYVSGPSEGLPLHMHPVVLQTYVLEGTTDFWDEETQTRTKVGPGDKFIIPPGAVHAEGVVKDRVVYLVGLPAAMPPEDATRLISPA